MKNKKPRMWYDNQLKTWVCCVWGISSIGASMEEAWNHAWDLFWSSVGEDSSEKVSIA